MVFNVIFMFNEEKSILQCEKEDKLKNVCEKFVSKKNVNINNLYFIYNGSQVNLNLTFDEVVDSIDRNLNEMKILVHERNKTIDIEELTKPKEILCPKCKEHCRISIKDYKIKLYECKNKHEINSILLNEYKNTNNIIEEEKIICDNCDISKGNKHNNKFYKCITCKKFLCPLCMSIHNNHIVIDYDKLYYTCFIHNQIYNLYCTECKTNLCNLCEKEHLSHKIVYYKEIIPNENEVKKLLYEFKIKIDKFNSDIRGIVKMLNKVIENMDIFYNINCDILNSYEPTKGNYQTLQNINEIKNIININDINKVINDNNIYNKFHNLLNISNKMTDKNLYNNVIVKDIDKEKQNNQTNDEILITYKIGPKNSSSIKLFDKDFIHNNKKNCKFIYEDKSYELTEYFNLSNYKIDKDNFEIKLTGINNITNMSYMFCGCSSLINLPNIDKLRTKEVTNMKYMLTGCSSLTSFPDISKWNTSNVTNMSYMFDRCSSLKTLPDISKWNVINVKNMNSMFCGCSSLTSLPDISKWNTINVINMSYLFCGCKSLLTLPDISK